MRIEAAKTHDPVKLMMSPRGRYLLAKALNDALCYAETYPVGQRDVSDYGDMITILTENFPEFPTSYSQEPIDEISLFTVAEAESDLWQLIRGQTTPNFTLTVSVENGAYKVSIQDNDSFAEVVGRGGNFRDAWFIQSAGSSEGLDEQLKAKVDAKRR